VLVAIAPTAEPPDEMSSLPVPEGIVPDAVPPAATPSTALVLLAEPVALTNVANVTPPETTDSRPPFTTVALMVVPPDTTRLKEPLVPPEACAEVAVPPVRTVT
jgi:hypothetical protein